MDTLQDRAVDTAKVLSPHREVLESIHKFINNDDLWLQHQYVYIQIPASKRHIASHSMCVCACNHSPLVLLSFYFWKAIQAKSTESLEVMIFRV